MAPSSVHRSVLIPSRSPVAPGGRYTPLTLPSALPGRPPCCQFSDWSPLSTILAITKVSEQRSETTAPESELFVIHTARLACTFTAPPRAARDIGIAGRAFSFPRSPRFLFQFLGKSFPDHPQVGCQAAQSGRPRYRVIASQREQGEGKTE
eukprot:Polyplicarium_translucidae@DN3375_c0_g1_i5.p4